MYEWSYDAGVWYRPDTSDRWVLQEVAYRSVIEETTEDDVVLDLGAHIGSTAVQFLRRGARVIAVEPNRENAHLLRHNVASWGDRCEVIEAAVASMAGSVDLYVADDPTITAMHRLDKKRGYHLEPVSAVTINSLLEANPTIIKCDIEGAEYDVLDPVALTARTIVVELHLGRMQYREAARRWLKRAEIAGFRSSKKIDPESGWARVYIGRRG